MLNRSDIVGNLKILKVVEIGSDLGNFKRVMNDRATKAVKNHIFTQELSTQAHHHQLKHDLQLTF